MYLHVTYPWRAVSENILRLTTVFCRESGSTWVLGDALKILWDKFECYSASANIWQDVKLLIVCNLKVDAWVISYASHSLLREIYGTENWNCIYQSINQISIAPISRRSQAQWCNSQIGVQIQSHWGYFVTSTGRWAHRCLRGKKAKSKRYGLRRFLNLSSENDGDISKY